MSGVQLTQQYLVSAFQQHLQCACGAVPGGGPAKPGCGGLKHALSVVASLKGARIVPQVMVTQALLTVCCCPTCRGPAPPTRHSLGKLQALVDLASPDVVWVGRSGHHGSAHCSWLAAQHAAGHLSAPNRPLAGLRVCMTKGDAGRCSWSELACHFTGRAAKAIGCSGEQAWLCTAWHCHMYCRCTWVSDSV